MSQRRWPPVRSTYSQWALDKPTADVVGLERSARTADFETTSFTICAFVNASAVGSVAGSIFDNFPATGDSGRLLRVDTATRVEAFVSTTNSLERALLNVPATLNAWHFVWCTCDGTTLSVGMDALTPGTNTLAGTVRTATNSAAPLLYTDVPAAGNRWLVGQMAGFAYLKAVLTDEQLQAYRRSGGALPPGLAADRVSWMPEPKAGTGVDLADASATWAQAGAGDALVPVSGAFETRRID